MFCILSVSNYFQSPSYQPLFMCELFKAIFDVLDVMFQDLKYSHLYFEDYIWLNFNQQHQGFLQKSLFQLFLRTVSSPLVILNWEFFNPFFWMAPKEKSSNYSDQHFSFNMLLEAECFNWLLSQLAISLLLSAASADRHFSFDTLLEAKCVKYLQTMHS